jgi:hypothetical protein
MPCNTEPRTARIRELNDELRRTLQRGKLMMTSGVEALGPIVLVRLLACLRSYDRFDEDNDPYGEHDFGSFEHQEQKFFWKIDYYDPTLRFLSEDPSDPSKTVRVLTLMLAHEY